jgi:hypothetical protein
MNKVCNNWIGAAVLAAVLGGANASCASTATHKIGVNISGDATEGKLDIGLGWEISHPRERITFKNNGDEQLEFCVLFLDKQGREKGRSSGILGPGAEVIRDIPHGATNLRAIPDDDCDEEDDDKDDLRSSEGEDPQPPGGRDLLVREPELAAPTEPPGSWHASRSVTLLPDLTGEVNVDWWLAVDCLRASSARSVVESLANHGFTAPLPDLADVRAVDVYYYCESRVNLEASAVELTFAEDQPFEELSIVLNGQTVATLAQGAVVPNANGWDARRFALDQALFAYDPAPGASWSNELEIRYRVEGQEAERVAQFSYEFENAP